MHNSTGRLSLVLLAAIVLFFTGSSIVNFAHATNRIVSNVAYGPDSKQKFDVYLPSNSPNAPILLMIHGGGWKAGDKTNARVVRNKAARWVSKGFVFISINYRLLPRAAPLEQTRDVARALAHVQNTAGKWKANPRRIIVMGHSSGAHLAALLAVSPAIASKQGTRPWLGTVLIDTAAFDIPKIMGGRHHPAYANAFGSNPRFWIKVSPLHNLKTATAPLLVICSTNRVRPCPRSASFVKKAKSLGSRASLLRVSKSHRELNNDLGLPGNYTQKVETFMASLSPDIAKLLQPQ